MAASKLAVPIATPIARGVAGAGVGGFNPRSLFASGEKGIIYDFSNASTLFTDTGGTTPVTTAGDSIARVNDLSPNGVNATQATPGSRPSWQTTYSVFDGSDDFWVTPSVDFSALNTVTVVASVRKLSDAARGQVVEFGPGSGSGIFAIEAPATAATNFGFYSSGTTQIRLLSTNDFPSPATNVLSGIGRIAGPQATLRINGVQNQNSVSSQGTGNYGNHPFYIGRRNSSTLPFNGRLYRLLVIGRVLTADELAKAEAWAGAPAGVFF